MTDPGTRYFFSYSRADTDFALELARDLRERGANLWVDQLDIVGGQRWDAAVEEALEACSGMVVVLSSRSVSSMNVMDEVSYAVEERKRVVPVLLEEETRIPFRLRRIQYVDFTSDYERGVEDLLSALGIEAGEEPAAGSAVPATEREAPGPSARPDVARGPEEEVAAPPGADSGEAEGGGGEEGRRPPRARPPESDTEDTGPVEPDEESVLSLSSLVARLRGLAGGSRQVAVVAGGFLLVGGLLALAQAALGPGSLAVVGCRATTQSARGEGEAGQISGEIRQNDGNRPVHGAQVYLPGLGIGALTNGEGRFLLSGVPEGSHTLRVEHVEFGSAECSIPVRAGGASWARFRVD